MTQPKQSLAAQARAAGVPYQTVRTRLKRGLTLEEALQPADLRRPAEGSLRAQCAAAGLSYSTYWGRRHKGLSHDEALATSPQQSERLLSAEQISDILCSDENFSALARRYNCSAWLISQIVHGKRYTDICLDIPRRERKGAPGQRISCWNCVHIRRHVERRNGGTVTLPRCGLGLPDPISEGAYFARFCNAYMPMPQPEPIHDESAA
jgi:hypothetical protein